jgi:DNA-binding GntR family transcriptional regulator
MASVAEPVTLKLLREVLSGENRSDTRASGSTFRSLLDATITLRLAPGQILSEGELMERTGAGRASIRMAVASLADLGLITPLARKGLVVAPVDLLEISAVYDARLAIETALARLAARRATRAQVEHLQALAAVRPDEIDDAATFVARDLALHLAIAAVARNQHLEFGLTRILPLSARLWHLLYRERGADRKYMFHHGEIVAAIAARDPDAAEVAVRSHLQGAREILANAFIPLTQEGGG